MKQTAMLTKQTVEIVEIFVWEENNVFLDLVLLLHAQEELQIVILMEVVKQIS